MKVLNLYSGIGGNRKLWEGVEVTAVELNQDIANIYKDFFPNDTMIVGDAHEYLLNHYSEYDFIWSSPPCPSHSKMGKLNTKRAVPYPDMKLYEEILLLQHYKDNGYYCIENVASFYEPLIRPQELGRHYYWANFYIQPRDVMTEQTCTINDRERLQKMFGFCLDKYDGIDKRKALRNCVEPETGLHIFNCAFKQVQGKLF